MSVLDCALTPPSPESGRVGVDPFVGAFSPATGCAFCGILGVLLWHLSCASLASYPPLLTRLQLTCSWCGVFSPSSLLDHTFPLGRTPPYPRYTEINPRLATVHSDQRSFASSQTLTVYASRRFLLRVTGPGPCP